MTNFHLHVACASLYSSNFCKLAAVGLGWDRAFGFGEDKEQMSINDGTKRWIEIDNNGSVAPDWRPFDLF